MAVGLWGFDWGEQHTLELLKCGAQTAALDHLLLQLSQSGRSVPQLFDTEHDLVTCPLGHAPVFERLLSQCHHLLVSQ